MNTFTLITLLLLPVSLFAHEKHEHREHGAHQHGSAEVSLAFDGAQGKFEFKSPSDSVVGFEHTAKSAKDIKARDEAFKKFESQIADMVTFEKSLNCQFKKEKLEMLAESAKHSDVQANFTISCSKSPEGSKVTFNFQKHFPNLKDVDVQILTEKIQKSVEAKSSGTVLELK
ncbi:ZrgA family zinc uptake protein [Bdellovibrio sp. HCB337]|uniref:ZrgA family zinc uptake protein n=1 Tax=Bdellovibrio sp. HCB337 TaxID=3394358 RepID=UPI0039A512F5